MTQLAAPPGATYAIVLLETPVRTAFFDGLPAVIKCMTQLDLAFACQVIRVQDDVLVWPIHSKGGDA